MFFNNRKKPENRPAATRHANRAEPSYIGREMLVEGQVSCDGELHVDGIVRGSVRAKLCVVDAHGLVQGEILADILHVRGRVIGPINGTKVLVYAGAHIEGDVYNESISIENGAYVHGSIRHKTPPGMPGTPVIEAPNAPASQTSAMPASPLRVIQSRKV